MTATFIGHRECFGLSKETLQVTIKQLIEEGVTEFLNGGMGQFDWMRARAVAELKKSYPQIRNTLVIPYLTFNIQSKELFDDVLYPDGFEKYHFKSAIGKRNQYMIDNADVAVCYVDHDWGGAVQSYQRAVKKGKRIINLADKT